MNITFDEIITSALDVAEYREALLATKAIGEKILTTYEESELRTLDIFGGTYDEIECMDAHLEVCLSIIDRLAGM